MQFLALIASFLFGRMNTSPRGIRAIALDVFDEVIHKSRNVVSLTLAGLGAVIFFCGGLFISLIEGTTQYDRVGYINMTSTLGAGLALMLISALGFAVMFVRAWPGANRRARAEETAHHHQPSGLEQALSVLVMDFVKERELRRQQSAASPGVTPSAAPSKKRESEASRSAPIH